MEKVLVTGATGFIGGHIAQVLHHSGYTVFATGRNHAAGQRLQAQGISFYPCDLAKGVPSLPVVNGIVHCAGLAVPWALRKHYIAGNITTTENVLRFAEENNVARIVYISTSSVYASTDDRYNVSETFLPKIFLSPYAHTKYLAEQKILASTVPSIILRPRAVIGAGDTTVLPRIIEAHQQGRLAQFRQAPVITDTTTINNLAQAAMLSLRAEASVCGHAFNITDGSPVNLFVMLNELFRALQLQPVSRKISRSLALGIASFSENISVLLKREPLLTRYTLSLLATSLTLNIEKAQQMLNFIPVANTREALAAFTHEFLSKQNGSRH